MEQSMQAVSEMNGSKDFPVVKKAYHIKAAVGS